MVLATVRVDQQSSFIELDGTPAFDGKEWDMAYSFSYGVAMVIAGAGAHERHDGRDFTVGGAYRLIDPQGQFVSERHYKSVVHAWDGRVSVRSFGAQYLEKLDGTRLGGTFQQVGNNREGRVVAVGEAEGVGLAIGWLDVATGDWAKAWPNEDYKLLCRFFDGLACAAKSDGSCGWYDREGELVIPMRYDACGNFSDGVAWASLPGPHFGVIDRSGNFVVEEKYDEITDSSEERMFVKVGDRWGLIDTTGRVIVEPQFFAVRSFSEGWASVLREEGAGSVFIDREGKVVLELDFQATDFHHDRAIFLDAESNKVGFIDRSGAKVIPAKYDTVHNFVEVMANNPPSPPDWYL